MFLQGKVVHVCIGLIVLMWLLAYKAENIVPLSAPGERGWENVPTSSNCLLDDFQDPSGCTVLNHDYCILHCCTYYPRAELFRVPLNWLCCRSSRYYFKLGLRPKKSRLLVVMLLLISGIEPNPGPQSSTSVLGLLNVRSMVNKAALIHDVIKDNKLDMLAVTETWVYDNSPNIHKHEAAPEGYDVIHVHRAPKNSSGNAHGGGIALIHRDEIIVKLASTTSVPTTTFELLLAKIVSGVTSTTIAIIYRPPSTSVSVFISELTELINSGLLGPRFILCGDLNCPGVTGTKGLVNDDLLELMDTHSLQQHVQSATSHSGNILDHIITPSDISMVEGVNIRDVGISDHYLITCSVFGKLKTAIIVKSMFRNWKRLDLATFRERLAQSSTSLNPANTADQFAAQFEADVTGILDELAPLCTSTRRLAKSDSSWLTPEAVAAKQNRRRLERRWKSFNQEADRVKYRIACREANRKIKDARQQHCTQAIKKASRDPRTLWRTVNGLLHPRKSSKSHRGLCDSFSTFFTDKITRVKSTVMSMKAQYGLDAPNELSQAVGPSLTDLDSVTPSEVLKILSRLPNKTSPLDYVHTSVLKSCSDVFAPLISHLANLSFSEGRFPESFKMAQVTPLLKKVGLDESDPANYRPISNLNTIGKVLERLFLARLQPHIATSKLFNPMQSAYRKLHSTETALLKIMDDLYRIVDNKKAAVLIGLDLSAAFDTIDHEILTRRLELRFGVSGQALQWITTYLEGRSQFVKIQSEKSSSTRCDLGVPQGSVLGPFLFSVYVSPISDVITPLGVQFHQYADDTQLYTAVKAGDNDAGIRRLEMCTTAVRDWFLQNGMLLNPDKSEVLLVAGRTQALKFTGASSVSVAGSDITFAVQLKSLGVALDQSLSLDQHVRNVVKTSNFHIRGFRHIRPLLDEKTANTIACSIVGSRLDYCNSLLYGTSTKNLRKLQVVQNSLARVVTGVKRRDHIRPTLKKLHWLPVAERIQYKMALITQKVITTQQPQYLADIVNIYRPVRELRSSSQQRLVACTTNSVSAERSFSCGSSTVWNGLPLDLRTEGSTFTFKKLLKTHLFRIAYCE